jgi:hypothetical protein
VPHTVWQVRQWLDAYIDERPVWEVRHAALVDEQETLMKQLAAFPRRYVGTGASCKAGTTGDLVTRAYRMPEVLSQWWPIKLTVCPLDHFLHRSNRVPVHQHETHCLPALPPAPRVREGNPAKWATLRPLLQQELARLEGDLAACNAARPCAPVAEIQGLAVALQAAGRALTQSQALTVLQPSSLAQAAEMVAALCRALRTCG